MDLRFFTDGRKVTARFTPKPEHNGFINVIHGGLLATVLDEAMVWGCSVQVKKFCYCAEMTVRYIAPVRPGEEIIAAAEMTENKRGRIYLAAGELKRGDGTVLVTSTGKYMPIKSGIDFPAVLADFEGTPEQMHTFLPGALAD
jgi:uncharacterized protein (TIGR00369 family)